WLLFFVSLPGALPAPPPFPTRLSSDLLSGRQAWLEGWTYAVTNMGVGPDFLAEKRWVNEELFSGLPAGEARALARQAGVRWLVLAKAWPGAPRAGLAPVYENGAASIYDLS